MPSNAGSWFRANPSVVLNGFQALPAPHQQEIFHEIIRLHPELLATRLTPPLGPTLLRIDADRSQRCEILAQFPNRIGTLYLAFCPAAKTER